MFLSKKEIKIFLIFFIIYSFFVQWIGWNEESHFALTRAVVDESRLEIDSFANQTSDRAFYNGHYYSDKDPGPSFLAVPAYALWKFTYNLFPQNFKNEHVGNNAFVATEFKNGSKIVDYVNPGFFILVSMILVTILTSCLFSALTVVLVYKISKYFTKNEKNRMILILTLGLGTLLFPNALVFMKHASETFFSFLAFYLLFKAKQEKIKDVRYFIFAGISAGFAINCSFICSIVALLLFAYLFYYEKDKIFYFLVGCFIGVLPFITYNFIIFNNPFVVPRTYLDYNLWSNIGGISGLNIPDLFVILRLLFYPERGLLFYYPALILSFIGLYFMYKKFKAESILILFIFIAILIINSSWWAWWGGTTFGPRHLTLTMPFLVIPLIYILDLKNRKIKVLVFLLILYSIFINFAGLQNLIDGLTGKNLDMPEQMKVKVDTFQVLENSICDYYIPTFFIKGSRSRILEILFDSNTDIKSDFRRLQIPYLEKDIRILSKSDSKIYDLPLLGILSIVVTICILLLLLDKKILEKIFPITVLLLILFVLFIYSSTILKYDKNWYYLEFENGKSFRWTSNNANLVLIDPLNLHQNITLTFFVDAYFEPKNLIMLFNGKQIYNGTIYQKNFVNVTFQKGEIFNNLNILTKESCLSPQEKENSSDKRCLNLKISNLTIS